MDAQPASLLKLSEVAQILGISRATAYRWAHEGRIPVVDLGPRGRRVPRGALDAAMQVWTERAVASLGGESGDDGPAPPPNDSGAPSRDAAVKIGRDEPTNGD